MLKKQADKITRYKYTRADGSYYIDIIDNGPGLGAWLTGADCCISTMLFGSPKKQTIYGRPETVNEETFIDYVTADLDRDIDIYLADMHIYADALEDFYTRDGGEK